MVQAAASGRVDFRSARLDDSAWWRSLRLTLSAMEQDRILLVEEKRLAYLQQLNASVALTPHAESVSQLRLQTFRQWVKMIFPWLTLHEGSSREDAMTALANQWSSIWGDINDPETQRKIEATAQALRTVR